MRRTEPSKPAGRGLGELYKSYDNSTNSTSRIRPVERTGSWVGLEEMERAKGIEPSCEAWKASVLPLNYARLRALRFGAAGPLFGKACIGSNDSAGACYVNSPTVPSNLA